MKTTLIKKSSLQEEGAYLASKWHKLYFLLSQEEFEQLFKALEFTIHPLGGMVKEENLFSSFVEISREYGKNLQTFYNEKKAFKMPSYLLTNTTESLYFIEAKEKNVLLKIKKPVIFLKPHFFTISDKKVHATLGNEAIFWGFCLSYPQIFQDLETNKFEKVDQRYANTDLFVALRKKLRTLSASVTFINEDQEKISSSYRLGTELFQKNHPDLLRKDIRILGSNR